LNIQFISYLGTLIVISHSVRIKSLATYSEAVQVANSSLRHVFLTNHGSSLPGHYIKQTNIDCANIYQQIIPQTGQVTDLNAELRSSRIRKTVWPLLMYLMQIRVQALWQTPIVRLCFRPSY